MCSDPISLFPAIIIVNKVEKTLCDVLGFFGGKPVLIKRTIKWGLSNFARQRWLFSVNSSPCKVRLRNKTNDNRLLLPCWSEDEFWAISLDSLFDSDPGSPAGAEQSSTGFARKCFSGRAKQERIDLRRFRCCRLQILRSVVAASQVKMWWQCPDASAEIAASKHWSCQSYYPSHLWDRAPRFGWRIRINSR